MNWKKSKLTRPKPRIRTGGKIFEHKIFKGLRFLMTGLFAFFFKLWWSTLRIRISDHSLNIIKNIQSPAAIICWHNHLFFAAYWGKFRPKGKVYALISAGTIGAWISPFFQHFNIKSIRGSINLRAPQALKEVVQSVRDGNDIAITPDGSRGPLYKFKPGISLVVKKSDPAIILFACKFHNAWRLKTWDKFYIPKPFSKIDCTFDYFSSYKQLTKNEDTNDITEALSAQLMKITQDGLNFSSDENA